MSKSFTSLTLLVVLSSPALASPVVGVARHAEGEPGDIADYVDSGPEPPDPGFGEVSGFGGPDPSGIPDSSPDPGMDPMAAVPEPVGLAPDQLRYGMPLEDIVEREMQEMDPYEMMDPYHTMGPYGPMPDPRMMGMPMNPFGPMGPMM